MKPRKIILLLIFVLLCLKNIYAQNKFTGSVLTVSGEPVVGAQLMLSKGDQLVAMALTSNDGMFEMGNLPNGTLLLEINALGHIEYVQTLTINRDMMDLKFVLQSDKETMLDDLVVVGDRVRQTATGEIFYLTDKAKKVATPFLH